MTDSKPPHPRMRTLRSRLFGAILGTVLVGVGASLALGVVLTREAVRDSVADELSRQADLLAERLSLLPEDALADGRLAGPPPLRSGRRPAGPPPFDRSGPAGAGEPPPGGPPPGGPPSPPPDRARPRVVTLDEAASLLPADAVGRLRDDRPADGRADFDGRRQLYSARPLRGRVLLLTRTADIGASDYRPFLTGLLLASALAAVLAAVAAALLSRRLAAPLHRLAEASRALPSSRRPVRLPPERTAELAALVDAFNDMAAQLARAREAERSVFLSVSHELRTPLTAIRGYAEGLDDGTIEPADAAAVLAREAGRLERLVTDLLALARLEQGVLDVRSEPIDLAAIAREVEQRLAPQARAREVTVSVETAEGAAAIADHDRVLQVLSNLVDNAVRVTPERGEVTIEAALGRLRVRDTGPGIPSEDLPRAFERFHLHRRGSARDGSGLGLAIVRELTEAMGGSVSVRSAPGEGAEFTVELRTR